MSEVRHLSQVQRNAAYTESLLNLLAATHEAGG